MIFPTALLFKTRFRPFEVALLVALVEEAMECELEQAAAILAYARQNSDPYFERDLEGEQGP
jgi:hypothetical protein